MTCVYMKVTYIAEVGPSVPVLRGGCGIMGLGAGLTHRAPEQVYGVVGVSSWDSGNV